MTPDDDGDSGRRTITTNSANVLMLLANGFQPDPRVLKEASTLVEHGFAVTIICLDREQSMVPEELVEGISIRRLRVGRVRPGRADSLAIALPRFYLQAARAATELHGVRPFDLVHCHDFDTVLLGLYLRRRLRLPVVYDLHDLYSAFFGDGTLAHAVQRIDRWVYRTVDAMILVNDRFYSLPDVDRGKTEVIMNAPAKAGNRISPVTDVGLFYAGNLNASRDMRYALPVLQDSGLRVQLAGDGPLLDTYRAIDCGERISFPGRIRHSEVSDRTRDCLAVLALYDTTNRNNQLVSPNKLFDAMKWGKPAIVSAGTVMAEIVERRQCGITVSYGDAVSLRAALAELRDPDRYDQMCRNAHGAFCDTYNWDAMAPRLLSLYQDLLGGKWSKSRAGWRNR